MGIQKNKTAHIIRKSSRMLKKGDLVAKDAYVYSPDRYGIVINVVDKKTVDVYWLDSNSYPWYRQQSSMQTRHLRLLSSVD